MSIQNTTKCLSVKDFNYCHIKTLPPSLIQYVLTFSIPKEHASCRQTCRQLRESLLLRVNLHSLYTLQDRRTPLDLSMRRAVDQILSKEREKNFNYCLVKDLPLSLIQYVLTFSIPKEHASCRRTCRQLRQSLLLGINLHKLYTLQDHRAPIDLSMRRAVDQILGKERDAQTIKDFRFPEGSIIVLKSGKRVDVSRIQLNLEDIFAGGIGQGGGASKLIARGMDVIGHNKTVYNAPVCIESYKSPFQVISMCDREMRLLDVKEMMVKALTAGYTHLNIALNIDGHASLASISINEETSLITFYDSFSSKFNSYELRYTNNLESFIQSLLPNKTHLPSKIVHVLDQGGENSSGCGYYSLYTALLLTKNESMKLLTFDRNVMLFNKEDDAMIRADLIVRTLVAHGLDTIDLSFIALCQQNRDFIFYRVPWELPPLIKQLRERMP